MPLPGATSARAVVVQRCHLSPPFYSHSIVPGGFDVMSYATRFTPGTSLMIRDEMRSSTSYGMPRPVGGHRVVGGDRAQHDRVRVGAVVAHHADGPHRGQHREALPDLAVQPGAPDLLDHDRVGLLQDLDALGRDRADDAHREPRARERLAPHDLLGQPELLADRAHLVLEQVAQRLDELEVHVVGEAADVVVRLDVGVVGAARLDDVGIQRALHEERARRRGRARPPRTRG